MDLEKGPRKSKLPFLRKFRHYWILPLITAGAWWGMLVALMAVWAGDGYGSHLFPSQVAGTYIPYISDIGASGVQPVFIACGIVQGVCFVLSVAAERYLRHAHRLAPNNYKREKYLGAAAIFFAFVSMIGIIFLTIFDTQHHHTAHMTNVCIFCAGAGVSACCSIGEYWILRRTYYEVQWLRFSYLLKFIWVVIALGLAIAFASVPSDYGSAAVEWSLAYFYPLYALILFVDLLPATKTSQNREHSGGYPITGALSAPSEAVPHTRVSDPQPNAVPYKPSAQDGPVRPPTAYNTASNF
ncbi:Frag1/DRAM/Sfk1 family-domain-containing protein [Lipomyces oligophaga]|uniref:Frag1/DRAM/Sfk1 family-domain-containing protein n=1 Tax=Lipomyces oligophaga TaxID=45792 RepID=UPI0034D005B2